MIIEYKHLSAALMPKRGEGSLKIIKIPICLGVLIFVVLGQCTYIQATLTTYDFTSVLPNWSIENVDIGETQLFVVVSDEVVDPVYDASDVLTGFVGTGDALTEGDVLFTFYNLTSDELTWNCSIVDIYFYDGILLAGSLGIVEYDGDPAIPDSVSFDVQFSEDAAQPAELNTLNWLKLVAGYSVDDSTDADAEGPVMIDNGIGTDEFLSISFDLLVGETYDDVIDGLTVDEMTGLPDMFIGLRVHYWDPDGLIDGECQFVSYEYTPPIPAPGAVMLGGIGVVFVGWLRRKRTL